jgi:hypothetical protein
MFDEKIAERGFPTWLRSGVAAWAKIIANDDLTARSPAEGFEHTPPTIVIEGVDELVEALRAA